MHTLICVYRRLPSYRTAGFYAFKSRKSSTICMRVHLREVHYLDGKPVIVYVLDKFGVKYSISGMMKLTH
ncbi:MAG: hypothetical protein LBP59_01935 [Planctomycetaceae bacterium]|nr:hypothetical protein [Planctomycetaceae bacterium]